MRSASAYTNAIRIATTVRNNKVDYPGRIAKNFNSLNPVCPISPDFSKIEYVGIPLYCNTTNFCPEPKTPCEIYTAGNALTEEPNVLSGGDAYSNYPTLLTGGNAINPCS